MSEAGKHTVRFTSGRFVGRSDAAKELRKLAAWCEANAGCAQFVDTTLTYAKVAKEARRRAKKLEGKG